MRAAALGLGALMFLGVGAGVARADTDENEETVAKQHHARGLDLISQRRFVEALAELEEGYRHAKVSSFLYNMGRAAAELAALENNRHQAMLYRRRAVMEWRAYLKVRPDAPERSEIEARMESLNRDIVVYEQEREARRAREAEAEAHRAEVESLRAELRAARNQLATERARHDTEVKGLKQQLDEANGKLEAMHATEHGVEADLRKELHAMSEKLDAERGRADEARRKLERTVRDMESDSDKLKLTISTLKSEERAKSGRRLIFHTVGNVLEVLGAGAATWGSSNLSGGLMIERAVRSETFNGDSKGWLYEASSMKTQGGVLLGAGVVILVTGLILNLLAY